jgi:hypothetical protein
MSALALRDQWSALHVEPGMTTVLAALDRAADIERWIGNSEARNAEFNALRWHYWTDVARALEPIAPTVCILLPGLRYDDELPGFYRPWLGEVPVTMVRDLVREVLR